MATIQCNKPVDQETTAVYRKTTVETSYNKANNEHSFGNKMKEMANSATKLFHHGQNEHQANHLLNKQQHEAGYKAQQTGTGISSNTTNATNNMQQPKKKKENLMTSCTGKKKKQEKVTFTTAAGKKEEKHGGAGGFLANMEEHVKLFAHKVDGAGKKKKSKGHGGSSSDDSSSDESDNDCRNKKK